MNTGKQINAMVVVLFLTLIAIGAYTLWDPVRSDSAEDEQLEKAADFGATTFTENCRLCHGDLGEGGVDGGRLPASLPLDTERLQSGGDEIFKLVINTITCGRVGKAMPTWAESQGGILNDEQIRQLAVLITEGRWDLVREHADEVDAEATGHATIEMPDGSFGINDTELIVSNAASFKLGQYIRIEEERLRIRRKELEVERGVDGTEALPHEGGIPILRAEGEAQDTGETLTEEVGPDDTFFVLGDTKDFTVGETLQLGDEKVRVVDIVIGLPSIGQRLAEETGRTPREFLVSGAEGFEVGGIIRLDGELMEVTAVRDDGDPDIELDGDISITETRISVSDPVFFRDGYVLRVGDELIEVVGPVETGQTLGETVGRAETTFTVSGTEGIRPEMVLRMGQELLRVTEIVEPARLEVERGVDNTVRAPQPSGTAILRVLEETEEGEAAEDPDTGQTLLEPVIFDDTLMTVSGLAGITAGETYQLGDEVVRVVDVQPARLRVERGVDGTTRAAHARRVSIFEGNLLEVDRGVDGTWASAHNQGEQVFITALEVKRAVAGSAREDHVKNAEIYLGNQLIVERGILNTEPAEHPNGVLVRDFPPPPGPPSITGQACGQIPQPTAAAPTGPTPTPGEGPQVAVSLTEWEVAPDPTSIADGSIEFRVANTGTTDHNFRVVATDLAADELPLDATGQQVDEEQVDVVGGYAGAIRMGETMALAIELPPGTYVLFCNVPTHYGLGMYVDFEVTSP